MVQATENVEHQLKNWEVSAEESSRINGQINAFVDSVSPSVEIMEAINGTYLHLKEIIEGSETIRRNLRGHVSLHIYGSVVNGLFDVQKESGNGGMQSDLDLTLIVDEPAHTRVWTEDEILEMIKNKLKTAMRQSSNSRCVIKFVQNPYDMSAGALLEINCQNTLPDGTHFTIDVDISINKPLEILNSQLICTYCMMDDRFRKVALVLKNWNRSISNQKVNRLNSFSIYLLLLAFMLEQKYLINLQAVPQEDSCVQVKVHTDSATTTKITAQVNFLKDMDQIDQVCEQKAIQKELRNQNKTAADILVAFLKWYGFQFISKFHVAYVGPRSTQYFFTVSDIDHLFHPTYVQKRKQGKGQEEFTVRDPFNNTYNPAKVQSRKKGDVRFSKHFQNALQKLLTERTFIV